MLSDDLISSLHRAFPGSFVNPNEEFIAHRKSNTYFILQNCKTDLDVKCKVLEWFSRSAYKAQPYHTEAANRKFHRFMLDGVNQFLGANFTEDDMAVIYQKLGNCVRHNLTIQFVKSGYDMGLLMEEEQ